MRRTYAYNSIIIGVLLGMLVGLSTESVPLAVLVGLGVSVVGFIVIRLIENALYNGMNAAVGKVQEARQRHKAQQSASVVGSARSNVTRMPARQPLQTVPAAQAAGYPAQQPAEPMMYCPWCGETIRRTAAFCKSCGGAVRRAQ